ncbi:MAG: tetratricopeptide repeat protein [Planctomycetota bacterium]
MRLLEQITSRYPETPCGQRVAAELEQIRQDEQFMVDFRVHRGARKAREALSAADAYFHAGMTRRAEERYRELIRRYPDTDAADRARARLNGSER